MFPAVSTRPPLAENVPAKVTEHTMEIPGAMATVFGIGITSVPEKMKPHRVISTKRNQNVTSHSSSRANCTIHVSRPPEEQVSAHRESSIRAKTKRQSQKCGGDVPPPVTQANPLSPSVEVSELVDHVCYHSHTRTQPTRDA